MCIQTQYNKVRHHIPQNKSGFFNDGFKGEGVCKKNVTVESFQYSQRTIYITCNTVLALFFSYKFYYLFFTAWYEISKTYWYVHAVILCGCE